MAEATRGNLVDVVVVYERQEHYVQAAVEPNEGINVELLQCQILSLVGLLPEEQILVSSRGEIITSPFKNASLALPSLPVSRDGLCERVFVVNALCTGGVDQQVPADWRQICTRCTFGDLPVVQPAFRAISGGDTDQLVCGACAATCSTDTTMVTPLDWQSSKQLGARFISELLVVAGEADVPTPPGFTKVRGDLNFSASGDFVHLFVKRGGARAVTQLFVAHQQCSEENGQQSHVKARVCLPIDCNSGNESDVSVILSYETVSSSQEESSNSYAITEVVIVVGNSHVPEGFIKIPMNLNEGCAGSEPLYLGYKLSPLGGFTCATVHGAFGECLFQSRHASSEVSGPVVPAGRSPQSDVVLSSLESARQRADNSFLENHYRQYQPGMRSRLVGGMERVKTYENPLVQAEALKRIPVTTLHERARANPTPLPAYQDELVMQLTHWFKREFFSWMNQPKCSVCSFEKTQLVRTDPPATPEEVAGEASRVEVYQCSQCRSFTRFPRYNNPVKLLDTRTGRCGEWANCFTLCCRAMGFEARYVLDVTDHVWTEVYSEHFKRWLHCDSCEDQLDRPLTYEVGWGKKLSYIFSFSHEEVVDTAQRYTQNWDDMKFRRTEVSEAWLASTIQEMNQTLRRLVPPDRARILDERAVLERAEFIRGRTATDEEVQGRISGSEEWKSQRKEDGQTSDKSVASDVQSINHNTSGTRISVGDLTQNLVKTMLLGCDRGKSCNNPSCMHQRSLHAPDVSPTERAAQALQDIAVIQARNFSPHGLASLLCPEPGGIQDFILSHGVELYLPLQDSKLKDSSSVLVDVSGKGHHGESSAPLRKPFLIPSANGEVKLAFGVQLLSGRQVVIPTPKNHPFVVSWLARFDPAVAEISKVGTVFSLRISDESECASVLVRSEHNKEAFVVEAISRDGEVVASLPIVHLGLYYHFAAAYDEHGVVVYVNAKEVARAHTNTEKFTNKKPPSKMTFQSSAVVNRSHDQDAVIPVISHVAVLTGLIDEKIQLFNHAMKERFVCWPPLQAFDASGIRPDISCTQPEATLQSGYRVCRVKMWGGEFFDGIQLIYERIRDGSTVTVEGPLIGNRAARDAISTPTADYQLFQNEFLVGFSGRKGAWTDCIHVKTSFGRIFSCGGSGGGDFSIRLPPISGKPAQIRAIKFDVGDHLVDAVAFVGEAPSKSEDETLSELRRILDPVDNGKRTGAISAVSRYLENIVTSPKDMKFQKIRASNKFFTSSIGMMDVGVQKAFMAWCGFADTIEAGETYYVFQPEAGRGFSSDAEAAMRLHYIKTLATI